MAGKADVRIKDRLRVGQARLLGEIWLTLSLKNLLQLLYFQRLLLILTRKPFKEKVIKCMTNLSLT